MLPAGDYRVPRRVTRSLSPALLVHPLQRGTLSVKLIRILRMRGTLQPVEYYKRRTLASCGCARAIYRKKKKNDTVICRITVAFPRNFAE